MNTPHRLSLLVAILATLMVGFGVPAASAEDGTLPAAQSTWSIVADGSVAVFESALEPGGAPVPLVYEYLDGATVPYELTAQTFFANPLVLHVVTGAPGDEWVEVIVPVRPLQTRWVRTAGFEWRAHDQHVHAFLDEFAVEVHAADGSVPFVASIGIGSAGLPTATGASFIDEIVVPPQPELGPWLMSIALFSEFRVISGGGIPKMALTGTTSPEAIVGMQSGPGVMRMAIEDIEAFYALLGGEELAGTPFTIWATRAEFDASQQLCGGHAVTVDLGAGQVPTTGDDVILGTAGDDAIAASSGDDIVCGLGGNDSIWGQGGNDTIFGGDGDDRVRGGDGDDLLDGGAGVDDLNGGRDDDYVLGGDGADAVVRGGTGDDFVTGGQGNDALVSGNGGRDLVDGGDGDDLVRGGPRPDVLYGGPGADKVQGLGGADSIYGGAGDDELLGGAQPDLIEGGPGMDTCGQGTEGADLNGCE